MDPEEEKRRKSQKDAIRVVITSYAKNFSIITLTILVTGFCNKVFNLHLESWIGGSMAALFYSGGTLSYLIDWRVKTWGGKGFSERLNESLFIVCYILGTVFTVLSFNL